LESESQRDYFVLESTFKGNFLLKESWRQRRLDTSHEKWQFGTTGN